MNSVVKKPLISETDGWKMVGAENTFLMVCTTYTSDYDKLLRSSLITTFVFKAAHKVNKQK